MEFSREQFYLLRDVAARITHLDRQFRYSKSAFELCFVYHTITYEPSNPILRGLITASAAGISCQLWLLQSIWLKAVAVAIMFGTVVSWFQGGSWKNEYGGKAELTLDATRAAFLLTVYDGKSEADSGGEISLTDIKAIRIIRTQPFADEEETGQIQFCRATTNSWQLFAELPSLAAEDLASFLQLLTAAPFVRHAIPTASWPAKAGRRFGQLYRRLSAVAYPHS